MSESGDVAEFNITGEAIGTVGLFLSVSALIAFSICLGSLALGDIVLAAVAGMAAIAAFALSMTCFVVESERSIDEVADIPVPVA